MMEEYFKLQLQIYLYFKSRNIPKGCKFTIESKILELEKHLKAIRNIK